MSFTIDTKNDTIEIDGTIFHVERETTADHMGEALTVEQFPGLVAEIKGEPYIEEWMNPRADCDGILGVMVTEYRGHSFGGAKYDEDSTPDFEIECSHCEGSGESYGPDNLVGGFLVRPADCFHCGGDGTMTVDPATWARKVHGARVVLPLFVYDHSGISMSAGAAIKAQADLGPGGDFDSRGRNPFDTAGWDTSAIGIVFDTAETREECGWNERSDEEIEADIRREIDAYDDYLQGMVSYYSVEDDETGYDETCGGFLGDNRKSGVESECFCSIGSAIVARLREISERADMAARDIVTL